MTQYDDQLRNRHQRRGGQTVSDDDFGRADTDSNRDRDDRPYYAGGTYQARQEPGGDYPRDDYAGGYPGRDYRRDYRGSHPGEHYPAGRMHGSMEGYQGGPYWGPGYQEGRYRSGGYQGRAYEGDYGHPDQGRHDERYRSHPQQQRGNTEGYGDGNLGGPLYRGQDRHPDPDYDQWRRHQISALDRDYDAWRQERYQRFSDDFNSWRSSRADTDNRASTEATDVDSGLSASQASGGKSGKSK